MNDNDPERWAENIRCAPGMDPKRFRKARVAQADRPFLLPALFRPRFGLVDLLTWLPLGNVVSARYGLGAGLLAVVVVAAVLAKVRDRVLVKGEDHE